MPEEELVDRSRSPWDDGPRRPSHADRRKALLRQTLQNEFREVQDGPDAKQKLRDFAERLMLLQRLIVIESRKVSGPCQNHF